VGDRMIRVVLVLHVYIRGYMYMEVLRIFTSLLSLCAILGNVGLQ
jgi:hypothetical protein